MSSRVRCKPKRPRQVEPALRLAVVEQRAKVDGQAVANRLHVGHQLAAVAIIARQRRGRSMSVGARLRQPPLDHFDPAAIDLVRGHRASRRRPAPASGPRAASTRWLNCRDACGRAFRNRQIVVHLLAQARWCDRSPRCATGRALAVTSAVTCGLPSRSPPIQEPNRKTTGTGTRGPDSARPANAEWPDRPAARLPTAAA